MRVNQKVLILAFVFTTLVFPTKPLATSWAFPFVVWEDYIYVVTEEEVPEGDVGKEIGQVTIYSDMVSISGNFSNIYPRGTKYYSIQDVKTDEAIAVFDKSKEVYYRAYRESPYEWSYTIPEEEEKLNENNSPPIDGMMKEEEDKNIKEIIIGFSFILILVVIGSRLINRNKEK